MAQVFGVICYQINSSDQQLGSCPTIYFPSQGITIRGLNTSSPAPLSTGVYCYGQINVLANGTSYATTQTAAQLATLANA